MKRVKGVTERERYEVLRAMLEDRRREIHDKRTPGNIFSVRDLTWDAIGATAGAVMLAHTTR